MILEIANDVAAGTACGVVPMNRAEGSSPVSRAGPSTARTARPACGTAHASVPAHRSSANCAGAIERRRRVDRDDETPQVRRTFGATRQLPSGRWQACYIDPTGTRQLAEQTFTEAADANAWLSDIEHAISAGDWRAPELGRETFEEYGQRWLAHRPDLRPRTAETYEGLWRLWIKPTLGSVALKTMTPETWRAWYLEQKSTHPGSTQPDKAYRLARAILNQAVDDGILRANPCRVKGAGQEHAPERPVAMPDQVARLAEAIDPRWRPMVLLAAYGSMRFGELAGLRRGKVDVLHRTITIDASAIELNGGRIEFGRPKTDAGIRIVAIPAEVATILEAHLAERVDAEPSALVFTSTEGHPLRRTKFRPH
jgi:integrase